MKKRILIALIALVLTVSMFFGCSAGKYKDGTYFARGEVGDAWTSFVIVTVEKGKIANAYWGGTNFVPQGDKRVLSENGGYDMTVAGAKSAWYEQAQAAEAWLIENQDPTAFESLYSDAEGHTTALTTDTGASVSIHVSEFFTLVEEALASDPIAAGKYGTTPVVTVQSEPDENGWQTVGEFIVANGTIVGVNFDAIYTKEYVADGDNSNAKYFKIDGDTVTAQSKDQLKEAYGMTAAGSTLEWYQQAQLLEDYILTNQTIFAVNADGYADSISGVSIHAAIFYQLFTQAFGE